MSEEIRKKKPERQQWKPNFLLVLLHKAWMLVFSAAKIALGAAATVLIIGVICLLAFAGALSTYLQTEIVPQGNMDLEGIDLDQSSFVYYLDENGEIQLLQQIYGVTDREWVEYEDIPEVLINAAIAVEDQRFYEHQGVDWFTTIKAFANMFMGDDSKGGSTLTQQLVKNLTGDDSVTVQRKLLELFKATDLEKRYDKNTIIEWYLNYIYMGNGCYGVKSAAAYYYGKEVQMLTLAESASLISITNNPSVFAPYGSTFMYRPGNSEPVLMTAVERNRYRQSVTLKEMLEQGLITQAEHDEALAQEIVFKTGIDEEDLMTTCENETCAYEDVAGNFNHDGSQYTCPICGTPVTVREDASLSVYSWFVDTVLEDVAKDLAEAHGETAWNDSIRQTYMQMIGRSGYHIYTTLDMEVQNQVDEIYTDLEKIPDTRSGQQLQSAIVVIDNKTGDIVAMAGGVGNKDVHDGFNRATDNPLQTGSSIKPLTVYGPAFEVGAITPATVIKDLPYEYTEDEDADEDEDEEDSIRAFPYNDNRRYSYSRTIFSALEDSVNAVAVNIVDLIGVGYSYEFGKETFRLSGLTERYVTESGYVMSDLDFSPLALGSQTRGVTVRDMSSAFASFANNGIYREGRTYTVVYDTNGSVVLDNTQDYETILSEKTVNYMNYCLTNAVEVGTGTAARMYQDGVQYVAGKTGTTASSRDRWFCGYTQHYSAAVWCGYDIPEVINLVGNTQNPAARLWKMVMEPLHEELENAPLFSTEEMVEVEVCLDSGKLATNACHSDIRTTSSFSRVEKVYVYPEDAPTETCDDHVMVDYCAGGDGVATEWCEHFASANVDEAHRVTLRQTALVKLTRAEIDEMLLAEDFRLWPEFLGDEYVYLVTASGRGDYSYKGLHGDINEGVNAPYKVCTVHTQESWDAYIQSQIPSATEGEDDSWWDDFWGSFG